jgi:hypothetical protein
MPSGCDSVLPPGGGPPVTSFAAGGGVTSLGAGGGVTSLAAGGPATFLGAGGTPVTSLARGGRRTSSCAVTSAGPAADSLAVAPRGSRLRVPGVGRLAQGSGSAGQLTRARAGLAGNLTWALCREAGQPPLGSPPAPAGTRAALRAPLPADLVRQPLSRCVAAHLGFASGSDLPVYVGVHGASSSVPGHLARYR